jgi:hypothetical protein
MYKYCAEVRPFPKPLIEDLHKKGFIVNTSNQDELTPDDLILSDKVSEEIRVATARDAEELFDNYPTNIASGTGVFLGRTISPEDLSVIYAKKLQRTNSTHEDVMKAMLEQKENMTLGMGLKKWFETEQWLREDNTIDFTDDI